MKSTENRVERDAQNAKNAKALARDELKKPIIIPTNYKLAERSSLETITNSPFHAMAEVEVKKHDGSKKKQLWYANKNSNTNIILRDKDGNQLNILSWTHPGIQLALSEDLGSPCDISDCRYALVGVLAKARAKFKRVFPSILGIYEPGGSIGREEEVPIESGLKAVKLDMTKQQVQAFISKMSGIMFVTGAPGSGKTTVALQRVRFLFDQQELCKESPVGYSPEKTKIFLANQNLKNYSQKLLKDHLNIPLSVVELVPAFISDYLSSTWIYKHNARWQPKKYDSRIDQRAREAFFSLCLASDLQNCWRYFENQIVNRLLQVKEADWYKKKANSGEKVQHAFEKLADVLRNTGSLGPSKSKGVSDPLFSEFRMDRIFKQCKSAYEHLRETLADRKRREEFDSDFMKWLFYVYDPLNCLHEYFGDHTHQGELRIKEGTGGKGDEKNTIDEIFSDWSRRIYRKEEEAWLAWLIRFALPEETASRNRFAEVPPATSPISFDNELGWTHIVIDEAQDLSVAEASFLCSFVHPRGALTVSADFRQVVSPVHGMPNPEAIKLGSPIKDRSSDLQFPFTKNMRQTRQITDFLRAFYNNTFNEPPPFLANDDFTDIKPRLYICKFQDYPEKIRQIFTVLQKSKHINNLALLQINEDEDELMRLRSLLKKERIPLAPIWEPYGNKEQLVTTSVERVKGLEYDCCLVIGMDNVEQSSLKYTVNRVYVAISRPARRLAMFCERYPKLLHGVSEDLFDIIS